MKQWMKKTFAWVVALVMMLGCAMAAAEQTADLEALYPLMDLVCAAALDAQGEDDYAIVVPDSEGELTPEFVQAFIRIGQTRGESVGVTAAMMTDTAAQKTLLSSIFDAQLPELTAVTATDGESNYIGFRPVTVNNTGENNTLQIIGEIYTASKPLSEMSGTEFTDVTWLDRGIFTFRSDASVPRAMGLVALFYAVFTPLSTWGGSALTNGGWNEDLVLVLTMLLNFVLEFLYQKFVVYRNRTDTNDVAKRAMEKEQEKQNKAC